MGVPSVFLRLQACNLLCEFPCDTIEVWKKGSPYTIYELKELFEKEGYLNLLMHNAHLILTGGEPLLQQDALYKFYRLMHFIFYVEVETNCTIMPTHEFYNIVNQFNCCPKTSNSGIPKERRYKPEVIEKFASNVNTPFKFVIDKEEDIREVLEDFVVPFYLSNDRIWLMPQCITREQLHEKQQMVANLCKKYGFNFSSRLQIDLWDKCTGV